MRGKTKIGNSLLIAALILSTLAFVSPAFAPSAGLRAPTIINPYLTPGQIFTADIIVSNVVQMYQYELVLSYDTNIITATNVIVPRVKGGPNFPFSSFTIDDTTGTVTLSAHTDNNTLSQGPPLFPQYNFAPLITATAGTPIAIINFQVDARGVSALDIHDSVLYDRYMVAIEPHLEIDGSFDNNFQGLLEAPMIKDEMLMAEDIVEVDITIDDVKKLWGYQFTLSYDTNVLTALDWDTLSRFTMKAPSIIDDAAGFARLAANSYFGDKVGLTTTNPVAIAKIYFQVDADGWSKLDLSDEVLATTSGNTLVVDVHDGAFVSVNVADLKGRAAWPDVYKFVQSKEPDPIDTLYARVAMNMTGEPVLVQVVFSVYDREFGILLGTIKTTPVLMGPLDDTTVTADFDTNAWGTPGYKVTLLAQAWYDVSGDGVMDFSGYRIKPVNINVQP